VPGVDAAGVIDALGPDTDGRLAVGDRVIAVVVPMDAYGGSYAEQIVANQKSVVPAPKGSTHAEASTLLLNALTAHLALDALHLASGRPVAVTGAAGALGGYAIQLSKAGGYHVIAVADPADAELVRSLGADHVVDRGDGMALQVRELVPGGVARLVDAANLDASALPAIADAGALATVRGWSGPAERGITVHPLSAFGAFMDTVALDRLRGLAEDGTLTLRVADILPAAHAAQAHRRLAAGGIRGRVVLDFASPLD
jgi:NADPH:quinone reductase-like Zn-dependent oxidoreductase